MKAAAVAALGLLLGLWGLDWGLPSSRLINQVLPPGLDTPAFHRQLADSWKAMHQRLGENLMLNPLSFRDFAGVIKVAPGWTTPPPPLMNTARSFYVRSEHEDEQTVLIMLSRLNPLKLQLNPHFFTYGAAYVYSVGAALAVGAVAGTVELHRGLLPYMADPSRMAGLYYTGRLLSVLAYAATGVLLFFLGRRYWGENTGLFAAAAYLFTPAAILQSHVLKNHAFWAFWATLTVYYSLEILTAGERKAYLKAGVSAGLTVGSFLVGWPACLVIACACAMRVAEGRDPAEELKGLGLAALAAAAAFFITNPYWVISWKEAMAEMKVLGNQGGFEWTYPAVFLTQAFRKSVTTPFFCLVAGGAVLAALRRRQDRPGFFILLVFLCGLTATFSATNAENATYVRYFSGWVPAACLLAARAAAEAWRQSVSGRAAVAACAAVLAAHGLAYSMNYAIAATDRSTHWQAGRWIEENIPEGEAIGLIRLPQPSNAPFFRYDRYEMVVIERRLFPNLPSEQLPRYFVATSPDYDDTPDLRPNLDRYELLAEFDRISLGPAKVDPTAMTANPKIEVYRLKNG